MSNAARFEALADYAPSVTGARAAAEYRERLDAVFEAAFKEARDADSLSALLTRWIHADAALPSRRARRPVGASDGLPPRVVAAISGAYYAKLTEAVTADCARRVTPAA